MENEGEKGRKFSSAKDLSHISRGPFDLAVCGRKESENFTAALEKDVVIAENAVVSPIRGITPHTFEEKKGSASLTTLVTFQYPVIRKLYLS